MPAAILGASEPIADVTSLLALGNAIIQRVNLSLCMPMLNPSDFTEFKAVQLQSPMQGVCLYQHHATDLLRPWRGLNIKLDDGAVRFSLVWFGLLCGAGIGFQSVLVERIRAAVGADNFTVTSDKLVSCTPNGTVIAKVAFSIIKVLLQSVPCSGAYHSNDDDDQRLLLGPVGNYWKDKLGNRIGVTAAVAAGSQATLSLPMQHVNQLTVNSIHCVGWLPRCGSDARCDSCLEISGSIRRKKRTLKEAANRPQVVQGPATGGFPISARGCQGQ